MSPIYNFLSDKKRTLKELESKQASGLVDEKVITILKLINSHQDYYTTSSCSGRVLLIALAHHGTKDRSEMLARFHDNIKKKDLKLAISKWKIHPELYFLAQPPIFHVTTHDLDAAIHLRNLGESAGFKYTTIRSIKKIQKKAKIDKQPEFRITVELLGTERLNVPLGVNGRLVVDDSYLDLLVKLANEIIMDSDKKIKKLEMILKDEL